MSEAQAPPAPATPTQEGAMKTALRFSRMKRSEGTAKPESAGTKSEASGAENQPAAAEQKAVQQIAAAIPTAEQVAEMAPETARNMLMVLAGEDPGRRLMNKANRLLQPDGKKKPNEKGYRREAYVAQQAQERSLAKVQADVAKRLARLKGATTKNENGEEVPDMETRKVGYYIEEYSLSSEAQLANQAKESELAKIKEQHRTGEIKDDEKSQLEKQVIARAEKATEDLKELQEKRRAEGIGDETLPETHAKVANVAKQMVKALDMKLSDNESESLQNDPIGFIQQILNRVAVSGEHKQFANRMRDHGLFDDQDAKDFGEFLNLAGTARDVERDNKIKNIGSKTLTYGGTAFLVAAIMAYYANKQNKGNRG